MKKSFKVNNKLIGDGKKTFIIAEIGINHQGNLETCKKMIKSAALCGADAAKIQLVDVNESYDIFTKSYKQFKNKNFSDNQLKILKKYAQKNKIIFFATPGDIPSLKRVIKLKFCIIKVSSGLSNNYPLIREAIKSKIPLFISTGMSNKDDLIELSLFLKKYKFKKIIIMKCISDYPTNLKNINMKTISALNKIFEYNIGYSDHSLGDIAPISSVSLGACVIEKHFTLNKKLPNADHKISMEPKEFKAMVNKIRQIELLLGKSTKIITKIVTDSRRKNFRLLTAKNKILKNEKFSLKNISFKRYTKNTKGLLPKYFFKIEGKKSKKNIKKGDLVKKLYFNS